MHALPPDPALWTLVWSDEFEGDTLDRSKWDCDLGNGFYDDRNQTWVPGWGNEELQHYTDDEENISVRDSCVTIRALPSSQHDCGYTSARLKTRARDGRVLFSKRYGRFEFRARVPWGKGLWPACLEPCLRSAAVAARFATSRRARAGLLGPAIGPSHRDVGGQHASACARSVLDPTDATHSTSSTCG
jgi:hypothetical protein